MWLIEALKQRFDVTVVTTGGWRLGELNESYGTRVQPDEVAVRLVPGSALFGRLSVAALRGALYQRYCRRIATRFDLRVSAYNCTDWGAPAIHWMADFAWHEETRAAAGPSPGFVYQDTLLRRLYLSAARKLTRASGRSCLQEDCVIANSRWTAAKLIELGCSRPAGPVYPPVWLPISQRPWAERKDQFVAIGRVAPEKRIEEIIAVIAGVRQLGHDVSLTVAGSIPNDSYGRRTRRLCERNSRWVQMAGYVSGDRKSNTLSSSRYGISMCSREAFGISVAEMVRSGCIPFAPAEGGQREILDNDALLFRDRAEAISRIDAVLRSGTLRDCLRQHLASQAQLLSSSSTVASLRQVVRTFLQSAGSSAAIL